MARTRGTAVAPSQLDLWAARRRPLARAPGWAAAYLQHLTEAPGYAGELVHVEELAARAAVHAPAAAGLPAPLAAALAAQGIERLYAHQLETIEQVRSGGDVVVVSGTDSGKSLCYNLPILETLLADPQACAIYLFPTKALAQDQLLALRRLGDAAPELGGLMHAGTYDGDTTAHARRKLRERGNLILSNPDMLHQAILPYHTRWSRILGALRAVVLDEVHTYRGVFGSQVANVLRRLQRLCELHGSQPVFVMSSATIRNPAELAARLVGRPVRAIASDGSPRGRRLFAFWNPVAAGAVAAGATAAGEAGPGSRRPAAVDATRHFVDLVRRGVQTIVFTRSRVTAELVLRYARQELAGRGDGLARRIGAYRAGYLPGERRRIEQRLHAGELLGVVSTNALELGIDIGRLDAAILLGFPPTIASAWQQAGRAGRQAREALVIAVAYEDPIDQYLMRHPRYFFGSTPECAVIDPDNPYVVAGHLGCAAHELPLDAGGVANFGELAAGVRDVLLAGGRLHATGGRLFWSSGEMPARAVNLRAISDDTYTILDADDAARVVGTVDGISALELLYPEAVYLHEGITYWVRELDLEQKVAFVEERAVDYYTQPVLESWVRVEREERRRPLGGGEEEEEEEKEEEEVEERAPEVIAAGARPQAEVIAAGAPVIRAAGTREPAAARPARARSLAGHPGARLALGDAEVSWQTVAMRKVRFQSRDAIGYHALELPRLALWTRALWLWIGETIWSATRRRGRNPVEPLSGLRNLLITLTPMHIMCDPSDLGGVIDTSNTGRPCIFLFDRYPGGLGFCDRAFTRFEQLLDACLELAHDCPCQRGCPSCVGLPILRPAQQQDPDAGGSGWPIPDKRATVELLEALSRCRSTPA